MTSLQCPSTAGLSRKFSCYSAPQVPFFGAKCDDGSRAKEEKRREKAGRELVLESRREVDEGQEEQEEQKVQEKEQEQREDDYDDELLGLGSLALRSYRFFLSYAAAVGLARTDSRASSCVETSTGRFDSGWLDSDC